MASLLFTVGGAVVNAPAISGTNFVFSMLTDHGAKEHKRHDLAEKSFKGQGMNGIEIERNVLILSTNDYVEKMRQRHTSTTLMKQCLSTTVYLQNK